MRYALIAASALCGLTSALPQVINIEAALAVPVPVEHLGPKVEDAPTPVAYNQAAAAESAAAVVAADGVEKVAKREVDDGLVLAPVDACASLAKQPGGAATKPGDGSVDAYKSNDSTLRKKAQEASTPTGYTKEFSDEFGSTEQIGYLTYKIIESGDYDVKQCADFCDSEKFCLGFNIFYERDPSVDPTSSCTNPEPITNVKCSIYGYPVAKASATNQGQWREQFNVVIVGSNGYSKLDPTCKDAPTVAGFNAPENLKAAINAPLIQKNGQDYDTYNGMRLFNDGPYDPKLCAAACDSQTAFDKEHLADVNGNYKPCNFFTSYILTKNGVPLGTYCALYTQYWGAEKAVNTGYYYGDDAYKVTCAASYTATTLDSGNKNAPTEIFLN
ncbi:hypothetical protein HBI56_148780 [Parastagonospora nodorum]|uniref:Apple domain-containing protein n=2 Tax=Phaeosphaeria nodorum (strain SN15 / ATCC MYA-4574 / FGSC 10173) TaxID=321614 RepID=A0A7U2NQM0_PHANO|nr:hypothetical protein SNOG_12730 [Parastagonospora nodorum SN15]KAH3915542.1 hypothetical protein HBH56_076080 [Parastagonospora nodorum]EAT80028.1 hypothetical protein SNOG_12730 [Parastagonospora nodorum SN15]KAH3927466.1 hypothetical protein HBH54_156320 [Parastagonospora nodorum]KAH3952170.1 hypothetical protein HBH53_052070 [Parastagonospora nodorum]KAH3981974.1 hypothetical protein HBH51_043030 [Parastagonospora nodorum]